MPIAVAEKAAFAIPTFLLFARGGSPQRRRRWPASTPCSGLLFLAAYRATRPDAAGAVMAAPMLRTLRAVLRPLGVADLDAVHALWTDPDVRRYLWDDVAITRERAAEVVAASADNFRVAGLRHLGDPRATTAGPLLGFSGAIPAEDGGAGAALRAARRRGGGAAWPPSASARCSITSSARPARPSVIALHRRAQRRVGPGDGAAGHDLRAPRGAPRPRHGVLPAAADAWRARRIVVRPARSTDEPLLRSLTPRLADFPRPPWRTGAARSTSAITAMLFDALHHPREDALVLVAERPAGHAVRHGLRDHADRLLHARSRTPTSRRWPWHVSAQGAGVGRALLDAAEAWARTAAATTSP